MAALACAIGLTVKYGSTYRPVVEPVREIEEIWALEDAREESEEPLVTRLFCNGIPMAYDAENNVFYGSLGLENGAQWPEIKLTASEEAAKGLSLCFADDYGFDDCDAAIREGYSYQIFAYTDTAYSYAEVVFTGLPLVNVTADQTIEREDVPAQIEIALAAEGLQTNGRIHKRGGASILNDKVGYKLEFTRTTDGKKKIYREIPGMGTDSQVILLPMNALDTTMMRDRLSWALYARLTRRDEPFSARKTQYCELFLNGEYRGVYLMLEPFSVRQEVAKAGKGVYMHVDNSLIAERQLDKELQKMQQGAIDNVVYSDYDEQFQGVAILILILLIAEAVILEKKREKKGQEASSTERK